MADVNLESTAYDPTYAAGATDVPIDEDYKAKLEKLQKEIAELEESNEGDPLARMFRGAKLKYDLDTLQKNDTTGLADFMFNRSGGVAPFLQGLSSVKPEDIIKPAYKTLDPNAMNQGEMRHARDYNTKLQQLSTSRPLWTAGARGLGTWMGASMGLPGLIGGIGVSMGVPALNDWWQKRQATKYADQQQERRMYLPQRTWGLNR